MIRIAIDAMGGDNAPVCNVKGAVLALNESKEIEVILVGREKEILPHLQGESYDQGRLRVMNAEEVIETGEPPAKAIRTKKDSSICVGMRLLKDGAADAFVSCGSTGAVLVGGQLIAGRLPGIRRPALAVLMPTAKGTTLLIDCGANVDAKPENLVQFAHMGSLYMKYIMHVENPSVGLVNIGTEEEKGNALTRETYPLLKAEPGIHFFGNAEVRDIPAGICDVAVCEAFTGNVITKMYEGVAKALFSEIKKAMMSSTRGKIGGLLVKPSLKKLLKTYDASEYGGAPLLGLSGLVVKAHGNSEAKQVKNAILQCIDFSKNDLSLKIVQSVKAAEAPEAGAETDRVTP